MLNQLKNLGLSENEAKVYMAMLELGPANVLDISAKAGVNRPTTYVQIEVLKKVGLVSTQTKGKKQLFIAESPEQLEFMIDRQKTELDQKKEELHKLLPELTNLFNLSDSKPQVRFFEGREGLMKMHSELLKSKNAEVVSFTSTDGLLKIFPDYSKTLSSKRIHRGIRSRLIYTNVGEPVLKKHDDNMLREAKYVSPDKFPFKSDVTVYGDSISISAFEGNVVGVLITHRELADSFRALFNLLWDSLGE
ncbi:MAG: helix-turn-helix domain-containing protein [Candidatus Taylorbacteria bacterium]|nr:helix-turn-helix domain-containing protein [Candidatus Taylorbacteria bacterium]